MNIRYLACGVLVLLCMLHTACLQPDDLNLPFQTYTPAILADGLPVSTPDAEQIEGDALTSIYQDVYMDKAYWSVRSLLVFRHGRLVAESYLKDPADLTQRHLIWSCTKQFMGVLTGIALENGIIQSLDDPISDYFDTELVGHAEKADISIRNLLTMRSGIAFSNDGLGGETDQLLRQLPNTSVEFILGLPLNAAQGTTFDYNDGNPHLLSALIQKQVGIPTDEWADEVLFSRIGLTNYNWVRYRDGITFGAFGLEMTPREMARLAILVANKGVWEGAHIVDSNWIDQMTMAHAYSPDPPFGFGYYWWVDENRNLIFMNGHGGQYAFIVPESDLIVVMTSFPNTQDDHQLREKTALKVVDRIIGACY